MVMSKPQGGDSGPAQAKPNKNKIYLKLNMQDDACMNIKNTG